MAARSIPPLLILDYRRRIYPGASPPVTDEGCAAYAKFAAAAVTHYKDFPNGRSIIWEIWNKPNGEGLWKPRPNADDYAGDGGGELVAKPCAPPTRNAPLSRRRPRPLISVFWRRFYQHGLLAFVDGVSVRAVRGSAPETAAQEYARLRALIARYRYGWDWRSETVKKNSRVIARLER